MTPPSRLAVVFAGLVASSAAVPPTGAQTCPSNPATSVIVELPEPLGERTVLDGLRVGPITDYLA